MEEELDLKDLPIDPAKLQKLVKQLEAAQRAETRTDGKPPEAATFMGMTMGGLFAGLVVSTLGIAYIRYAKTTSQYLFALCGLLMLVVPFFVSQTLPLCGIGFGLALLPVLVKRFVRM